MGPKVVVLINHYNRSQLLARTLASIFVPRDPLYQVVILDNDSDSQHAAEVVRLANHYNCLAWNIPKPNPRNWFSSIISENQAMGLILDQFKPDVIVRQDAECYHVGDVISHAAKVSDDEYISFGCFSADRELTERRDFEAKAPLIAQATKREARGNGDLAWYCHPVYRGVAFSFCGAMTARNVRRLNWFDERYAEGQAVCDADFVRRIKILGLQVRIPIDPFVVHQWHYDQHYSLDGSLWKKNEQLHQWIAGTETGYRAVHTHTPDFEVLP